MQFFESLAEFGLQDQKSNNNLPAKFDLLLNGQNKNQKSDHFLHSFKGSIMEFPYKQENVQHSTNFKEPSITSRQILFEKNDLVKNLFDDSFTNQNQLDPQSLVFLDQLSEQKKDTLQQIFPI